MPTTPNESVDPRGCLAKFLVPTCAVFAWQGCDEGGPVCMAILCGCFYTLLCWKPAPEQKIWEADATKAKKVLCCGCHPLDKCCRFWFPFTAIASWQGCDVFLDFILAFVVPCYACCCWQPRPTQKIWGAGAGAPVVGQPQAAETTPLTAEEFTCSNPE